MISRSQNFFAKGDWVPRKTDTYSIIRGDNNESVIERYSLSRLYQKSLHTWLVYVDSPYHQEVGMGPLDIGYKMRCGWSQRATTCRACTIAGCYYS